MTFPPSFLRRLFRGKPEPRGDGLEEGLWDPERLDAASGRFAEESGEGWAAAYRDGRLELELGREGLFAWTEASGFNYDDFVVEGELRFPEGEGYGAAGFLFRYVDEANFYLLLLSTRGYFRLDNVFNGSPRPLIGWTEIPERLAAPRAPASLRLIARGSHFSVMVEGSWVGEAMDETARSGSLAFAAQCYRAVEGGGAAAPQRYGLASVLVEARPVEVEALYQHFTYIETPAPEARRRLAETQVAMGQHLLAAVQLRKIEKSRPLDAAELLLKAETDIRLELFDEAMESLEAALVLEPARAEALVEKANLLYLRARFSELRSFIEGLPPELRARSQVEVLLGHALFNLGDYLGSAAAYARAAALEPEQPLFRMNEARAWEQGGRRSEAREAYVAAARGFFVAEAVDELKLAEQRLESLAPEGRELGEIRARSLFLAGHYEEAAALIDRQLEGGSADSALAYLGGLVRQRRGDRKAALAYFERALALEPGVALYAMRRAECLLLLGRPEAATAIEEALALNPEDPWTLNLAGQAALEAAAKDGATLIGDGTGRLAAGDLDRARQRLEKAVSLLPRNPEPRMNLAELLALEGRLDEGLELLRELSGHAEARNQAGTIISRQATAPGGGAENGERELLFRRAEEEYREAIRLEPERSVFHENLAALLIEVERWSDAEEEIRRALELGGGSRTYLLAGNLALVFGDLPRAETAFRVGLEGDPADPALTLALGRLRIRQRRWAKAGENAEALDSLAPALALRLRDELRAASTEALSCSSCGREWRVPRDLPSQSVSNIRGMPPDEAPAGSCPSCGKIFCIACRKDALVGNRFVCPDCGENLKLSDDRLRFLVREAIAGRSARP